MANYLKVNLSSNDPQITLDEPFTTLNIIFIKLVINYLPILPHKVKN